MKKRDTLLALAFGATFPAVWAQPAAKLARITYLTPGDPARRWPAKHAPIDAFKEGLRELGYVEGKNFVVEMRRTMGRTGDLPALAKGLAAFGTDVILATGEDPARAAQQAAPAIPVVLAYSVDPVVGGLAKSLSRPGGNVTGIASLNTDLSPKLLEFLLAVVPKLTRTGALENPAVTTTATIAKNLLDAARAMNVGVLSLEVQSAGDIEAAFARMAREKVGAVVVLSDPLMYNERVLIGGLALKHRIASVFSVREHVIAGGLLSYGVNLVDGFRRAASFVDRILKGAKPGDLPIEQPTKFELVVNRKTAKALGITIPQSVLMRADEVIE